MINPSLLLRWTTFIRERFNPLPHFVGISAFLVAHYALYFTDTPDINSFPSKLVVYKVLLLAIGTTVFFFKLRLSDDLKDYEIDLVAHPERPLPRGLLIPQQIRQAIWLCIFVELLIFGFIGLPSLASLSFTVLYSFFMLKEFFFLRSWLRSHLTTYAVIHTFVAGLFSIVLSSTLTSQYPWNLGADSYGFALGAWLLFNVFEFGRKAFSSEEERVEIVSYSKIFGRGGATILMFAMAIPATIFLVYLNGRIGIFDFISWMSLFTLGAISILYSFVDRRLLARIYRTSTLVYGPFLYFVFSSAKIY